MVSRVGVPPPLPPPPHPPPPQPVSIPIILVTFMSATSVDFHSHAYVVVRSGIKPDKPGLDWPD